jgi:hypothetical protein
MIPAKHGVDRFGKLCTTVFVDASRVYPEVIEAILCSLLPTEGKLAVTFFSFACITKQILVRDFLAVRAPGMRENRIGRNVVALELNKAEATSTLELQKTHR